jgi:hypothetical protein
VATNAPKSRRTHVTRIFGTNKKKEINHDIWVDVERIDKSESRDKIRGTRQKLIRRLKWRDDPKNTEDYLDPDVEQELIDSGFKFKRVTKLLKVCDPESTDINDPDEWVPIRVIKRIRSRTNSQKNDATQTQMEQLINDDIQHSRVVEPRRIVHYDTNIDDLVQKAIAEDPTIKAYVVESELQSDGTRVTKYQKLDGKDGREDTKDEDQWVEHEIITKVIHKGNSVYYGNGQDPTESGPIGRQTRKTKFLNQYQIDESEPAKLEKLGTNDINPPYRLDPYQNIINVQLTPLKQAVIGQPIGGFSSATKMTMSTKDGLEFNTDNFGDNTYSAASGLGKNVVGRGYNMVVFGKPRDGAACFIVVDSDWFVGRINTIRRGALNDRGELEWTTIDTFPSNGGKSAYSCSFAGEAFFIQYPSPDGNEVHMAVSFDGKTFRKGIEPFKGVNDPSVANPDDVASNPAGAPIGGSVAYDKKNNRYVTTGYFNHWYKSTFIIHGFEDIVIDNTSVDANFMSSVSRDGLNWTPKFDTSRGRGFPVSNDPSTDIACTGGVVSTVAFSDALGLFISPTLYKKVDQNLDNSATNDSLDFPWYVETSAVATSSDGVNWTNHRVGSGGFIRYTTGAEFSFSMAVIFVKTGVVDKASGSDGFFLLSTNGGKQLSGAPIRSPNEIWRSVDGMNWTSVRKSSTGFSSAMTLMNKNVDIQKVIYV